jgi:hypothetical protein
MHTNIRNSIVLYNSACFGTTVPSPGISYIKLVYELPEDRTEMPKHVGVIKECITVYAVCAFSWFIKENKLIQMHGVSNLQIHFRITHFY